LDHLDQQPAGANPLLATLRQEGPTAILQLSGEIDGFADAALDEAYTRAIATAPKCLLLNFTAVDYINSTGIALIVAILAKTRSDNIALLTCGLSEHYQEMFRITRLSDFIPVFPDEASALAAKTAD
jgi:anti-sigma B factor antagonist